MTMFGPKNQHSHAARFLHRLSAPVARRMQWSVPHRSSSAAEHGACRDADGHRIFSRGDVGRMHVIAHRLSDEGRMAEGHRVLGEWLDGRHGAGSDWVHIQFHMAVFELALGDWGGAYARFLEHILPAVVNSDDALTDAPALLWRLRLYAPRPIELPWQLLRRRALARMRRPSDPYVELHNLLALAGAGDLESLDSWMRAQPICNDPCRECLLRRAAVALRAYAMRTYRQAAEILESLLPQLPQIGGSREQNVLFEEIARSSRRQLDPAAVPSKAAA